jgi:hypothetical protein
MDIAGDDLFASAGVAVEEDRHLGRRHLGGSLQHNFPLLGLTDDRQRCCVMCVTHGWRRHPNIRALGAKPRLHSQSFGVRQLLMRDRQRDVVGNLVRRRPVGDAKCRWLFREEDQPDRLPAGKAADDGERTVAGVGELGDEVRRLMGKCRAIAIRRTGERARGYGQRGASKCAEVGIGER